MCYLNPVIRKAFFSLGFALGSCFFIAINSARCDDLDWDVVYLKGMKGHELITIIEQARPHVWSFPHKQLHTLGIYDPCADDTICAAQREVDKMRQRKALSERIDEVVRVLREANK